MAVTTFIPELWNARLLYALEKAHVATNLVNRNYEGEIRNHGDTVHINTIGAITVKSYTKNTDIADPEVLSTTDQTLVIDQSKYFNFQVDDVDKVQAAGELVDTAMGRAAYALADVSDAYLLGVIAAGAAAGNTIGSAAAPVALTGSNVYENIVKLKTKLDKANVPNTGRTIVVPPDVHSLLLLDDRFAKSTATAGQEALINGLVGRIAGFDVYMSNNVKTGIGTDTGKTPYFEITAQITDATTYACLLYTSPSPRDA
jgi:N4-gp56 family major capsid protein